MYDAKTNKKCHIGEGHGNVDVDNVMFLWLLAILSDSFATVWWGSFLKLEATLNKL